MDTSTISKESIFATPKISSIESFSKRCAVGAGVALTFVNLSISPFALPRTAAITGSNSINQAAFSSPSFSSSINQNNTFDLVDARLQPFTQLKEGWCGLHSVAPSRDCIRETSQFLLSLMPSLPELKASAANDGEILLYLKRDDAYLEIGFYGDGKTSWYAMIDGVEYFKDDVKIAEASISPDFQDLIEKLS